MGVFHGDFASGAVEVKSYQIAADVSYRHADHAQERGGRGRIVHAETALALGHEPCHEVGSFRRIGCLSIVRMKVSDILDHGADLLRCRHLTLSFQKIFIPCRQHTAVEDALFRLFRYLQTCSVHLVEVLRIPLRRPLLRYHIKCVVIDSLPRIEDAFRQVPGRPYRDMRAGIPAFGRQEEMVRIFGNQIYGDLHIRLYRENIVRLRSFDLGHIQDVCIFGLALAIVSRPPAFLFEHFHTRALKIDHSARISDLMILRIVIVTEKLHELDVRRVKESDLTEILRGDICFGGFFVIFMRDDGTLKAHLRFVVLLRSSGQFPEREPASDLIEDLLDLREVPLGELVLVIPRHREKRTEERAQYDHRSRDLQHSFIDGVITEPSHKLEDQKYHDTSDGEHARPFFRRHKGDDCRAEKERDIPHKREQDILSSFHHERRKECRDQVDQQHQKRDRTGDGFEFFWIGIDRL